MKKILILIIIVAFILVGCNDNSSQYQEFPSIEIESIEAIEVKKTLMWKL